VKKKVLILTDHKKHSSENSLYALSLAMLAHPDTALVDIATRVNEKNYDFFSGKPKAELYATSIGKDFAYFNSDHPLDMSYEKVDIARYDLVWLRLPPPLTENFLRYISEVFAEKVVINNPQFIEETGSKEFLINFPSVCPPMKICRSLEDINEFKNAFSIVLKPFNEYGGKGIVKIDGDGVSAGNELMSYEAFAAAYAKDPIDYLAVKFLKNVKQGDKRIVVVNGQIMGASLRLPAENSWLCNVSMGGTSNYAEVEPEEKEIVKLINPILTEMGIVMYGVDTLVNDEGKRVLSEINTTSIGGLPQIAAIKKQPLVEKAIDLIWSYYKEKTQI